MSVLFSNIGRISSDILRLLCFPNEKRYVSMFFDLSIFKINLLAFLMFSTT